ncbi:MAG TPA: HD domain-containing phosphohydrolase [Abditibacteriaceae bacterium]|jgi:HD-GYP domain-containing protein (c-di-GMP phosphodiesterase class II)
MSETASEELAMQAQPPIENGALSCDEDSVAASAARQLRHLAGIGAALSAERNIDRLLERILSTSRELTSADAGSVYLLQSATLGEPGTQSSFFTPDTKEEALYFCKAQNDSVEFKSFATFAVSPSSLAGYAALTGETLAFDDVYQLPPDAPYRFNPAVDRESGYRTKSVLVVPMKNHRDRVIGVLQLINRKRDRVPLERIDGEIPESSIDDEVLPFDSEATDLAVSLASQAAVALENSRLIQTLEILFESFVEASSSAIEERDPSTSGHSRRVTTLTIGMAEAVNAENGGEFGTVFSREQLQELRYAALLHDFGKIGVREAVLTKSHKIDPGHFETIVSRLALRRVECRALCAEQKCALWEQNATPAEIAAVEAACHAEITHLDDLLRLLYRANDPSSDSVPDDIWNEQQAALRELASFDYPATDGNRAPLLSSTEIEALSVRRGSLTRGEFEQIKQHAQLSYEFLKRISWTPEYAHIPEIARGHHEKLNGSGYPLGVHGESIPLQTRLMTVADIYDALTASDRPYKKALPRERALSILRAEAGSGGLDARVVELFIRHEIYKLTE